MYNTILSNSNEERMWARDSGLSRPKIGTILTRKHWGISSARECETMDINLLRFYHKSQDKAYLTIWSKSQQTWHVGCLASWLTDWMGKWMDGWVDGWNSICRQSCLHELASDTGLLLLWGLGSSSLMLLCPCPCSQSYKDNLTTEGLLLYPTKKSARMSMVRNVFENVTLVVICRM